MTDHQKLFAMMRDMTRQLMHGGPQAATAAIQKVLQEATVASGNARTQESPTTIDTAAMPVNNTEHDINPPPAGKRSNPPASAAAPAATARPRTPEKTPLQTMFEHRGANAQADNVLQRAAHAMDGMTDFVPELLAKLGIADLAGSAGKGGGTLRDAAPALPEGAQFLQATYSNDAGSRHYKLYVPAAYHGQTLPLVVMLHGCTQNPDDFAAGTQMNKMAEQWPCLVLYPQQSQADNHTRCWNWFDTVHQQRSAGEPSIIAGMTRTVADKYHVDPRQIYIAGLSAGGAMAAIMGMTYPDIYAGVGVHSGLPYGAATDLPSALAAMRSGVVGAAKQPQTGATALAFKGIPVIVFHGDADPTVNMRNGDQVLASAAPATSRTTGPIREQGQVVNGHAYTRTIHSDDSGKAVAEHWLIHGFGHAWAGGSNQGSYTDARGPDATGEMMRFFSTHKGTA